MFYRVKSSKPIGVGRFPAGDYTLTYDAAGRLTSDGTRGITSVLYSDWSGIPLLIRAEGFRVNAEVTPDGKLRSRSVSVPYIESIVKVNAEGDTIVRQYTRNLSRSTRIYGCFQVSTEKNKSRLQINTSVGFYDIDEGRQYWHLTNYQGSVMALVDTDGRTHRRSALYPSGTPFVLDGDDTTVPDPGLPDDRHHIGNRWVSFGGLDWYDNTARMHDPLLMHFITPDPLAREFLPYSPWSHCAANPANIIDPTGRYGVRIIDKEAKTITVKANYYVDTTPPQYRERPEESEVLKPYSANDIAEMNNYNDFLNNLNLIVPSGKYKGYSVLFELTFINGGNIGTATASANEDKYEGNQIGNTMQLGDKYVYDNLGFETKYKDDGTTETVGGTTQDNAIVMNKPFDDRLNRLHEIFHTLGFTHPKTGGKQGIMKYPPVRPTIKDALEIANSKKLPAIIKK